MKEFSTAVEVVEGEETGEERQIKFKIDDRMMTAYPPTDSQMAFMLATMGRGQTDETRFGSMVTLIMNTLKEDDRDYFESRQVSRNNSIPMPVIEGIFEYIIEEWSGNPTQSPSDSAPSLESAGT